MADKIGDTWFEYDCPGDGIDYDVEPLPAYGSPIPFCWCGVKHIADEKIGRAFRLVADATSANGHGVEDITHEWMAQAKP